MLDALLAPTGKVQDAATNVKPRRRVVNRVSQPMNGPVRISDKVGFWECYKCTAEGRGTAELLAHTRKTGHSEFEDVTRFVGRKA